MTTLKDRFFLLHQRRPDISQTDLARAAGVSAPSVSAWISGKAKTMKHVTAVKAAALYGVDVHWLATGEGEMLPRYGANVSALPAGKRGAAGAIFELQAIFDELSPLMRTAARGVLHDWIDSKASASDTIDAIEQLRLASAALQPAAAKKTAA